MSRRRIITYAIDQETGMVVSRVGNEVYHPVLDFEGMTPENNFHMGYFYMKMPIRHLGPCWWMYKWTKKIPVEIKNFHREFWGFKPLKARQKVDK